MFQEDINLITRPGETGSGEPLIKGNYAFVSLGCPKNLVDSEKMLGTLALDGYTLVSDPDGADFVIVNTCGFIESSKQAWTIAAVTESWPQPVATLNRC